MSLAIENVTHALANGTSSATVTVNTSGTNRICVLMIMSEDNNGSSAPTVTSVTSANVTWVKQYATQNEVSADFAGHVNQEVWIGFAATALSSEVVTVDFNTGTDGGNLNYLAISGAAETSTFIDPNASQPAVSVSSTPSSTVSTTNNDGVVITWGTNGSRSGGIIAGSGFTQQHNYSDHSPSSWDIVVGTATKIVTSPESAVAETMSSSAGQVAMVTFVVTGDVTVTGPSGTWASTEATDVMNASGTGQPAPPNIDATFGVLTGHSHSITSPLTFGLSGTNKTAGAGEFVLACIGYNLRAGADESVASVSVTGLTFTHQFTVHNTTAGAENNTIEVWAAPASSAFNSGGANLTYTVDWNGSTEIDDVGVVIFAIQGLNSLTQPYDPDASLPGAAFNTTTAAPPTITFNTTLKHDLLIGITLVGNPFRSGGGQVPVTPSGWTSVGTASDGSGLAGVEIAVNSKTVTVTQSGATYTDGAADTDVSWTELVFALTADPTPPPTGTMAPTEAKDHFAGTGLGPPPTGTMAHTEAKDIFSGFEAPPLGFDAIATGGMGGGSGPPLTSGTVTLSTNHPEEVIVLYSVSGGHFSSSPIASVSDTAGLVWKRRNVRQEEGGNPYIEVWWAIAPDPLSADVITVNFAGTGAAALIAAGIVGANIAAPWDLHTYAGRLADNVGSGNPTGVIRTLANDSLLLALYASPGVDNDTTISAPFTRQASVNQTEHVGNEMFASLATAVVHTPQSNLAVQYGIVGGGFNARALMTDAIVAAGETGTADAVEFFLDPGGARETFVLTAPNQSVTFNTAGFYNPNLMYVAAILIQSATGLGTVTGITDSESKFTSPGFARRARVTDPTGTVALETWYAFSVSPPDGSEIFVIDTTNTVAGDMVACVMIAVGNTTASFAANEPLWDGSVTLPAINDSNTGGGAGVFPHVTGMDTINQRTLLLGITANLTNDEGPDATLPFVSDNPPILSLTSAGPPANIAIEFLYQPTFLSAGMATFDASPSPTTWVMIGDAIPVGPPVPPVGVMGAVEHPDDLTHTGNFTSIGVASPGGWFAYVPASALMAAHEAADKNGGAPAQAPYLSIGWLGWVPAHATMAPTDAKDRFAGGGWVIGEGITARMTGRELPDRMAFSNIGPAVTGTWHSTEFKDRFASAGFLIPKITPPTPRKRRVLIVS